MWIKLAATLFVKLKTKTKPFKEFKNPGYEYHLFSATVVNRPYFRVVISVEKGQLRTTRKRFLQIELCLPVFHYGKVNLKNTMRHFRREGSSS